MKKMKNVLVGSLAAMALLAGFNTSMAGTCSITRSCGSELNSITCTGTNPDCYMAPLGTKNPWVSCDGLKAYCFGPPEEGEIG